MFRSDDEDDAPLTSPDAAILSPDEIVLLKRVEKSRMWRLLRDMLCLERERLFAGESDLPGLSDQPETVEALWRSRGAILLIQALLKEGPRLVVWYTRHMAEQAEQRTQKRGTVRAPEREYRADVSEAPDFDV